MNLDFLHRLIAFIILALVQGLVLNHVHLFDVATPMVYVFFVLTFRRNSFRAGMLIWSFLLGLIVDIFSNTPGVGAASMTLMAFIQPYLLFLIMPRDSAEDMEVSMTTLGMARFTYFTLIVSFLFCLVFFTLEVFSFNHWLYWLECVGGSWVLTFVLILVVERFRCR
ncbi:MAG: rod shape-determining protein MreD [Prevotella sp.]|jgi:rod shape-determining protein MreD|nr:rod shape-determining protein MreD [Prevotella sp.]MBR7048912.1 rod shape-determining protein MreD [Prevotella sp.]